MTDADLAAARALAEGATPGPWVVTSPHKETSGDERITIDGSSRGGGLYVVLAVKPGNWNADGVLCYRESERPDLAFIAAARTLVPRLCDAVEQARRERDELGDLSKRHIRHLADLRARVEKLEASEKYERGRAETAERERDEARAFVREAIGTHGDPCDRNTGCDFKDRGRALLSPTPSPEATPHDWVEGNFVERWPHCARCGIIRRRDGKNSLACKGAPGTSLRSEATPPAEAPCTEHPTDAPGSPDACGGGA